MQAPVFQTCKQSAAVRALLGEAVTRIYPFGEAPQNVELPYVVWQNVTGTPENYISNRPDIDQFGVQIDVYGATSASINAVFMALRDAIEPVAHVVRWGNNEINDQTKRYRYSFDVDWYVGRD